MTIVGALDPGMRACGTAVFVEGTLVAAGLVRNAVVKDRGQVCWRGMAEAVVGWFERWSLDVFVTEYQQTYATRYQVGNQDDIIQLACTTGAICHAVAAKERVEYLPRQWKQQVPKDVMCARIESKLTAAEIATFEPMPKTLRHNAVDSVGIGLFYLGRL